MGGPSRESYLAAEARRQARLDALRTRDGTIALDEWRLAVKAAADLARFMAGSDWFLGAIPRLRPDVGFELVALLEWDPGQCSRQMTSFNDYPVRYVVRNPGARPIPSAT